MPPISSVSPSRSPCSSNAAVDRDCGTTCHGQAERVGDVPRPFLISDVRAAQHSFLLLGALNWADCWPFTSTPCHDGFLSSGQILDRATGRVVAVLVLLIALAAELRGYLPGVERTDRQQPPHSDASLIYVAALLSVSLVIVAVAFLARLRDPRRVSSSVRDLPTRLSGGGRPAWRVLLIGAALLVGWLILLLVLSRFVGPHIDQPQPAPLSGVPTPAGAAGQRPASQDSGPDRDVLRYLIAATVTLLVMIVAGAVIARRRRIVEPRIAMAWPLDEPAPLATGATALVRAAESGLAEIEDPNHDPRQAIIACYAAMECELRRFPGAIPQDSDTPTEVLARAAEHHALHLDNATELVTLFAEARFSRHEMTEDHRSRAIAVLKLVLADMRSTV